jgi:hypothetical protein
MELGFEGKLIAAFVLFMLAVIATVIATAGPSENTGSKPDEPSRPPSSSDG